MKAIIDLFFSILVIFVCTILYDICYAKLNNKEKFFNIKNLGISFFFTLIILVGNFKNNVVLKILINSIALTINFKLIFNDNIKKTIVSYIMLYLILIFLEMIVTYAFSYLEIFNENSIATSLTYFRLALSIGISFIEYLLLSIKAIKVYLRKLIIFFESNVNAINIAYLMFLTISILGLLDINNYFNNKSIDMIIFLLIIFVILFTLVIRLKYHEEILKITNKKLIDYNDNYGKFLDEYKIYKHNINHKLSAMKSFGNKKINALIDDLLEEETNFSVRNNEIYNIPNGIKGIVAEKLYNKKYDVLINNKVEGDPFSKLNPKTFNSISEALGIALDNAVEASEGTKNPIIIMDLYEDTDSIFIKVGNNYCNSIDLDELGNKYYSTKNRGSGLGLFSIKRNNLVKERIEIINSFFYIELQIKKAR